MRGTVNNNNHHNSGNVNNDDSYAKIKFVKPHFYEKYDAEKCLDWKMTIE